MPRRKPTAPTDPREPSPAQLVQQYIDSLIQEGANELQLAPADLARVLDRAGAVATDFAMRGNEIDEETMRWLKRSGATALSRAKIRNLGRATRAQAGAVETITGIGKLVLATLLAQVTPGTTLNRFTPPKG